MKIKIKYLAAIYMAAMLIQIIMISLAHYYNYYTIKNSLHLLMKVIIDSSLTFPFILFGIIANIFVIRYLNKVYPWGKANLKRIITETVMTSGVGLSFGLLITIVAHLLFGYTHSLKTVIINNILVSILLNTILLGIIESLLFYSENKKNKVRAENLEKENAIAKYELLKAQLNPHFLFNSLNILSSLVMKKSDSVLEFIDELSLIYRYVLEMVDKKYVYLEKELEFASSYLYLQKVRFGNVINYKTLLEQKYLSDFVPPLSLQTVLENIFKHNIINESNPVNILIYSENDYLIIENNTNNMLNVISTKVGIVNLKKRYLYLTDKEIIIEKTDSKYIVKLPIILNEK